MQDNQYSWPVLPILSTFAVAHDGHDENIYHRFYSISESPVTEARYFTRALLNVVVHYMSGSSSRQSTTDELWWKKRKAPAPTPEAEIAALQQEREEGLQHKQEKVVLEESEEETFDELAAQEEDEEDTAAPMTPPPPPPIAVPPVAAPLQKQQQAAASKPLKLSFSTKQQQVVAEPKPVVEVRQQHQENASSKAASAQTVVLTQTLPPPPPPHAATQETAQVTALKPAKIMVGILCHNGELIIGKTMARLANLGGQIVVCDDGSSDLTEDIARKMGGIVIKHPKPLGESDAIASLFLAARRARPEVLMTIPADSQFKQKDLTRLIDAIQNGECDVAVGSTLLKSSEFQKDNFENLTIKDKDSLIRTYSKKAIELVAPIEDRSPVIVEEKILEFAVQQNLKVKEYPMAALQEAGTSSLAVRPKKKKEPFVSRMINLAVVERPLIFFGLPALGFFIAAVIQGAYSLYVLTTQKYVPDFGIQLAFSLLLIATVLAVGSSLLIAEKEARLENENHYPSYK